MVSAVRDKVPRGPRLTKRVALRRMACWRNPLRISIARGHRSSVTWSTNAKGAAHVSGEAGCTAPQTGGDDPFMPPSSHRTSRRTSGEADPTPGPELQTPADDSPFRPTSFKRDRTTGRQETSPSGHPKDTGYPPAPCGSRSSSPNPDYHDVIADPIRWEMPLASMVSVSGGGPPSLVPSTGLPLAGTQNTSRLTAAFSEPDDGVSLHPFLFDDQASCQAGFSLLLA
eukprot:gene2695-3354_t